MCMEFDWCEKQDITQKFEPFNNSILHMVSVESKVEDKPATTVIVTQHFNPIGYKPITNMADCFELTTIKSNNDITNALQYLIQISSYMRNVLREENSKFDFDKNIKYLNWILDISSILKNMFISNKTNDLNDKNVAMKLFKTSSYNFCQLKETCSVHCEQTRKNIKKCNKHHFVFNYIINDVENLIKSLKILDKHNIDLIFEGATLNYDYGEVQIVDEKSLNCFNLINKNTICKCFDVISYVINKMFHEINCFLTYDIQSNYTKLF